MKICVVSSCGGHLTEVRTLRRCYDSPESFYVLNDRIVLPRDMEGRTHFIRHSERDRLFFVNLLEAWRILRKERPAAILSTGAGPAVPFALVGKLLGIPNVFVETFTRVNRPSLSGRIMYRLSDHFFYQWRGLESWFPAAEYAGSVMGIPLDEDSAVPPTAVEGGRGDGASVFATVGNATQGFGRLLEAVDRLAGAGGFGPGALVFVQSGNNPDFRPRHCEHRPFLSMEEFAARIARADLVICHGGAGTLLHVAGYGKRPIVMPRRQRYGEHVDDHQSELIRALAADGGARVADEPDDLASVVGEALRDRAAAVRQPPSALPERVTAVLEELGRIAAARRR